MPVLVRKIELQSCINVFLSIPKRNIPRTVSPKKIISCKKQNKNRDRRASLTAEAAMALPLFFYTLYFLWQCFLLLLAELSVCLGVAEITLTSASLGYLERRIEETEDLAWLYEPLIWNALCEKEQLRGLSVSFEEREDGKIEGQVSYVYTCQVPLLQEIRIPVKQCFSFMPYVGEFAKDKFSNQEEQATDVVYVTVSGTVFHESKSCSYLSVEVSAVDKETMESRRNAYGSKYKECSKCKGKAAEVVYISVGGTAYHTTAACASLKRVVEEKKREEVSLPACSRCGEQRKK